MANKGERTLEILRDYYSDSDILCVTEASISFLEDVANHSMGDKYIVMAPLKVNKKKDQNSFVLLSKSAFGQSNGFSVPRDITDEVIQVLAETNQQKMLADGDLVLLYLENRAGQSFVVGAFHGDTQGRSTIPMIDATMTVLAQPKYKDCAFVLGSDANCYRDKKPSTLFVDDFSDRLEYHDLRSCFGSPIQRDKVTTCMARTFLQPQMNKANPAKIRTVNGDTNPKDHIIYRDAIKHRAGMHLPGAGAARRDNSGKGVFTVRHSCKCLLCWLMVIFCVPNL